MQTLEQAHALSRVPGIAGMRAIALPVSSVVKADLVNYKVDFVEGFSLDSFLEKSGLADAANKNLDFSTISRFAKTLVDMAVNQEGDQLLSTSAAFEEFMAQLMRVNIAKDKAQAAFEPSQIVGAGDELKYQLLKLHLMHETTLTSYERDLVTHSLPQGVDSFT